jgi:hypothetical protein
MKAYDLAVLEADLEKLEGRIEAAKEAIEARFGELAELKRTTDRVREVGSLKHALLVLSIRAEHVPLGKRILH